MELISLFRHLTEFDQRLLISTAENMTSPQTAPRAKTD
jgi:hypothetical protein